MAQGKFSDETFATVLGDTAPQRPAPIAPRRGFGTTDTLLKRTRLASAVDNAHLTAMKRLSQKRASDHISNFANQYMIEDTKSRAGDAFRQVDYVVVTREEGYAPDYGLIARRA